ncbi:cytochrome P450 [Streptomyces sp. NPDC051554]|uniref:cytochrome P450 n=1 Tax=Streptomyces sp. NPDC051554 TaxID=3365656 RepID=UPI0037A3B322
MATDHLALFPPRPGPHGAPPPAYAELRAEGCPVATVRLANGVRARMVVTHEDVRAVLTDPRFSLNLRRPGAPAEFGGDDPDSLMNTDPPEHTRLRSAVAHPFRPRAVERWRQVAEAKAHQLLDQVVAEGPTADLATAYTRPLSMYLICAILGVPEPDPRRVREWSGALLSSAFPTAGDTSVAADRQASMTAFGTYVLELIADRRVQAGEGLLDDLLEGGRFTDVEVVRRVCGLMVAGYESTTNTLGRGVLNLLRHPAALAELRADPALIPGTVEEILRFNTPSTGAMVRLATDDVKLPSGVVIGSGEAVVAPISAANHDDAAFPDPGRFDIHRPAGLGGRAHLAFGAGPHFCLGARLARIELQVGLAALLARLPGLRLACEPHEVRWPWDSCSGMHGPEVLPVAW